MRPDPHSPSDERVLAATGRGWDAWFALLDGAGARDLDHRALVALVADASEASFWWQQTVTVAYEKARGLRATVGETADAGFQVGVRRTLDLAADRAWAWLVEGDGRALWLGSCPDFQPSPGVAFTCGDGSTGEVRTVRPGRRVRVRRTSPDDAAPTTLQLTIVPKDERCVVALHHERLPDEAARTSMKRHWTDVLDAIVRKARST